MEPCIILAAIPVAIILVRFTEFFCALLEAFWPYLAIVLIVAVSIVAIAELLNA